MLTLPLLFLFLLPFDEVTDYNMSKLNGHRLAGVACARAMAHLRARDSGRCGEMALCRARVPGTIRARDKLLA
jgi:hypothetical protein